MNHYLIRSFRAGFTLIEMLTVIAVIGILAAIVIASISQVQSNNKVKSTKSQVASIGLYLKLYRQHKGSYPASTGAFAANQVSWNSTATTLANSGIIPKAGILDDSWGHPFAYANTAGHYVVLCSMGKDGVLQTRDTYALSNSNPQVPSASDDLCVFIR